MRLQTTAFAVAFLLLPSHVLHAQREPVLKQIDLPHPYYYREMYLPQLTTGPSSLTWSPDSQSVAFSMQGALWRERVDSHEAEQLTAGPGYDYQPDWSPDGRRVVYASYDKDAIELRILDLETGRTQPLTRGGAVNVEPRWSPDGKRKSRWCLLRAWSEKAEYPILDEYPYATTSPIYISAGGEPTASADDAHYFLAWIDRLKQAALANHDWNTDAEKQKVEKLLSDAAKVFQIQIREGDAKCTAH